ncbi:MAG TPA: hypothetical protein VN611_11850 [Patescibacteria group bacterium]|nr:hypothetical protein [Patescibacteria group bacterium]
MWTDEIWGGDVVKELNGNTDDMTGRYYSQFEKAGDIDFFKITPTSYSTTLSIQCISGMNTAAALFDSAGNLVSVASSSSKVIDDNGGFLGNFGLLADVTAGSTYYLGVLNQTSSTGDYALYVNAAQDYNDLKAEVGDTTSLNSKVSGYSASFSSLADVDLYNFTPTESGNYTFAFSSDLNIYGEVYTECLFDKDGNSLLGFSSGAAPSITATLAAGTTYRLFTEAEKIKYSSAYYSFSITHI